MSKNTDGEAAFTDIDEIRGAVVECRLCGLCETRTNAVPGSGNGSAEIVFVGEAPGRSEDQRGEPFVGAAGTRLSAALEKAGISRGDVYITNVVKCRPPNNRVPKQEERQACAGHLQGELDAIKPRIICVMGNTAFGSLLGGSDITRFRGKTYAMGGNLYFACLHPAATIYNPSLVQTLEDDIAEVARLCARIRDGGDVKVDFEIAG